MRTPAEKLLLKAKLEEYEGRVPHMYLDARGFVTVGVGHLLSSPPQAQALPFVKVDKRRASQDEIKSDYESVRRQPMNRLASFYKRFTALVLQDADIDRLTDKHIESFHKELRTLYSGFDSFPQQARLALFDMVFNLGATNLRTQWPSLNSAILRQDWKKAAAECSRRPPVSAARNDYTRILFENAAATVGAE